MTTGGKTLVGEGIDVAVKNDPPNTLVPVGLRMTTVGRAVAVSVGEAVKVTEAVGEKTRVKMGVDVGVRVTVIVGETVGEKKSVANASFVRTCAVVLVAGVISPPVLGITKLTC